MKKLTLALSFVLGLSGISATQAQIKVLSNGDVKISSNPTSTAVRGVEIVKPNFIFSGSSMKLNLNSETLEISAQSNTSVMSTSSGESSPESVLLPVGPITVIGPHNYWDLGASAKKIRAIHAVTVNGENLNKTSDRRYKTNIEDLTPAMDKIMRLRPVKFDYREEKDGERSVDPMRLNRVGLIAQDLQEVIPEAVFYMEDDDIYTVDYTNLIPFLIKMAQEQQALIENQQLQIEALQMALTPDNATFATPTFSNTKPNGNPAEAVATAGNRLWSNVPNPFKQETRIRYALTEDVRDAQLCIYDLSGRQLSCHRLNDRGESEFVLRAATLNPGIYLYSLIADGQVVDTHRMVVTE